MTNQCRICNTLITRPTDLKRNRCKQCTSDYFKGWQSRLDFNGRIKRKDGHYKRYGITLADAIGLWTVQDYRCDCCKQPLLCPGQSRATVVDHCHKSGQVRAILCSPCNVSLGLLKEDTKRIQGLLDYANKHKEATNARHSQP